MDEYVMVLRVPPEAAVILPSQREDLLSKWDSWFNDLIEKDRLLPGKRLGITGAVIRADNVQTDGPFVEMKEQVIGFVSVMAHSLDDACELTRGCPVLAGGGSVEVRPVIPQRS